MGFVLGRQLVRSLNGVRIHRATCRWASPGHVRPWAWADTVFPQEIRDEVVSLGLRPCSVCKPLENL